ncbi:hypothetical protein SAMN04488012_107154 [Palleronia salina]|uniref:Uncharacterized protein n=1 Tax=Palleronia salina TaxID=313368 RepID=A0A1M6IEX5_9RHOB|nr:hypothetical protein [Palleronia salina]SHJ32876.1 hypothetical protein SAMN04488012_107154 [Palleronia salina]
MPSTPAVWLTTFTANTTTDDSQYEPQIVQLSDGNVLIAWTSDNATGEGAEPGTDIIGQLFDPFGNTIGGETRLNHYYSAHNERSFDIAALNNGEFVIVYEDENNALVDLSCPNRVVQVDC